MLFLYGYILLSSVSKISFKIMFHKANVIAGLTWISISTGLTFGQMAGLIGSLQKKEEGIHLSDAQISLIASSVALVTFFGYVLAAFTTDKIGRRWPFIIFSITKAISWIILYQAKEMYQFMLSRILCGLSVGALVMINFFITSEYTSPNSRPLFVNIVNLVAPAFGTTSGHIIGVILHWRIVALIAAFCDILSIFLPYFWVESPHWLASKGRFEECQTSFQKLHGNSQKSDRELHLMIKLERRKLEIAVQSSRPTLKTFVSLFKKKYIRDVFILSLFMHAYITASGKLVFSSLGSVIIKDVTGTSDVLAFTLLVDGFFLLGSCITCFVIRKLSMRTLLFSTGFSANIILVIFSLCFYFRNGQTYFNWINVGLLALYFILLNTGPYPILETMYSEMFPLEWKLYIFSISGSILTLGFTLSLFLLPYIVSATGYHGLFLINAAIMTISLGYIWLKLPETKGKTLQEIEMFFKTRNFNIDEVLSDEKSKALI